MRELVASVNVTLDGFMAGPDGSLDWHFKYWDGELCESLCRQLARADTILLGARTYEAFANYWPAKANDLLMAKEDIVMAELMNQHTKAVVSKSIHLTPWRNTILLKGKLKKQIDQLKAQPGRDIIVLGSGQLVSSLMKLNLVDRYELWVHPVVISTGKRLFPTLSHNLQMRLTNTQVFSSGIVRLSYGCEKAVERMPVVGLSA
jgi:dihydrofolate reductase